MKKQQRKLTAKYFQNSDLSRIYIDKKWTYTALGSDLTGYTHNDLEDYLKRGSYYRHKP